MSEHLSERAPEAGIDAVAAAVADPVRRAILVMLRAQPLPAGEVAQRIAERFGISRPAVSRHLRVLRESGLVDDTIAGRQRVYEVRTTPMDALATWLARFRRQAALERSLDALETEVYRTRRERRREGTDSTERTEQPARQERTA